MKRICLAVSIVLLAGTTHASDTAIGVILGAPTGVGLELTQGISPALSVRLGAGLNSEPTVEDVEIGANEYDVDFKFGGVNAFVDWHPWRGNFRVSGGVVTLRGDLAFRRKKGPFVLGEGDYSSAEIHSLSGVTHLERSVAPALLIGWGNAVKRSRRVGFQVEFGVAWTGDSKTTLTATGPLASDPVVERNLREEMREIDDDARHQLAGILRIGLTYRF